MCLEEHVLQALGLISTLPSLQTCSVFVGQSRLFFIHPALCLDIFSCTASSAAASLLCPSSSFQNIFMGIIPAARAVSQQALFHQHAVGGHK